MSDFRSPTFLFFLLNQTTVEVVFVVIELAVLQLKKVYHIIRYLLLLFFFFFNFPGPIRTLAVSGKNGSKSVILTLGFLTTQCRAVRTHLELITTPLQVWFSKECQSFRMRKKFGTKSYTPSLGRVWWYRKQCRVFLGENSSKLYLENKFSLWHKVYICGEIFLDKILFCLSGKYLLLARATSLYKP